MSVDNRIADIEEFCRILLASGLVNESRLAENLSSFHSHGRNEAPDGASLTAFTAHLIANRTITRWQSGKLCNGQYKGFFLDGYKLIDHLGDDDHCNRYLVEDQTGRFAVLCLVPPLRSPRADGKLQYWIEVFTRRSQ